MAIISTLFSYAYDLYTTYGFPNDGPPDMREKFDQMMDSRNATRECFERLVDEYGPFVGMEVVGIGVTDMTWKEVEQEIKRYGVTLFS